MATGAGQAPGQEPNPAEPPKSIKHCPLSHAHREDVAKVFKECKEESIWHRAIPLSLVSMLATQGLIYKGYLSKSARFGVIPKVALAGVLGFVIGNVSYMGECKRKLEKLGLQNTPEGVFGPAFTGAYGPGFFGRNHKHCHHCEECKKQCTKDKGGSAQSNTVS
ncbi:OCIA domain-containing protein 2-like [Pseudophryne corroboree]|uniref:OCIA domain-containing protein 2-like n=1 Tax=Pseudophryne corroboree TaxID=495146 RepID=UPI003082159A